MDESYTGNMECSGTCEVCGAESSKQCVRCMQVYYCTKDHQKEHWKTHKLGCHPIKVVTTMMEGRKTLVATRDIPKGEIIIKETPLITGPRPQETHPDRFPLCLECYRVVKGNYRCTKCLWPLCNPQCEKGRQHSQLECPIFTRNSVPAASSWLGYLSLLLLRGVLLKEDAAKWAKLKELESRTDQLGSFETLFHSALDFVQNKCQLKDDVADIKFVAGALQVNRMSDENDDDDQQQPFGSYLYYKTNFATHSCVPNSMWYIQTSSELYLRASIAIKKGALITTTCVGMEGGTMTRRSCLNYFGINCTCSRCSDPTELGTFMSAVTCEIRNCDNGYYLAENPLDTDSIWKCSNSICQSSKSCAEIYSIVTKIQGEFDAMKVHWERFQATDLKSHLDRIKKTEDFIKKYQGKVLHRNHSIVFNCKKDLCQRIPVIAPHIDQDTARMELEVKQVAWARECLQLADKFWPGYSRFRGQLLYNLQRGLFCLIFSEVEMLGKARRSRAYNNERVTKLREAFGELLELRKEVKAILGIESDFKIEKGLAVEMNSEGEDFVNIRRILQI